MIDRATIDRVLEATRIEDVIGDFVSLRRRGANWWGLCPFHQDKSPSMSVSTTKQIFKCFACGEAGTAVTFLQKHEHLSFPDAIRYLAKKYGIEIVEREESEEQQANRLKYESLLAVNQFAQEYFSKMLWDAQVTHLVGLSYFKERKFTDDTIRKFGLGYDPAGYKGALAQAAVAAGYKKEYLVETGLCVQREDGTMMDRFHERVIFPIHSLSGRVIAFGGRILTSDKKLAKYINSPESELYVKNRSLYGIYFAKGAIAKKGRCLLVEGYTDVISMHQAGIENVVASSGTSLTTGQIALIKRFTENITVIYDGDAAGIKASLRGVDMILAQGMKVKVVPLPPEDDPDSFAKAHTQAEIEQYIADNEVDFITFKANQLLKDSANDPITRAQAINDILGTVAVIPDQIERNVYAEMVADRFRMNSDSVFSKVSELHAKHQQLEQSRARYDEGGPQRLPRPFRPRNDAGGFAGGYSSRNGMGGSAADGLSTRNDGGSFAGGQVAGGDDNLIGGGGQAGAAANYQARADVPPSLEEYQPDGELQYADYEYVAPEAEITNGYLMASEQELVSLIVKYGTYPLVTDEDMKVGSAQRHITVADYIRGSLAADDLEIVNPKFRKLYALYFGEYDSSAAEADYAKRQKRIMDFLLNNPDVAVSTFMVNLLDERHPLTIKVFIESLVPEHQLLGKNVPKSVLVYKQRIVALRIAEMQKEIALAGKDGDISRQQQLAIDLTNLCRVKASIEKEISKI